MRIIVTTDDVIQQYAARLAEMPNKLPRIYAEGLNEGGDLERTKVRHDLKAQTGVKAYGSITKRTGTKRASTGNLVYVIEGRGKGMPIKEFPVRASVHRPVTATPWGVSHTFARSFKTSGHGLLRARLGTSRFPIRALFGPSVAKEIVKDRTAADFEATAAETVSRIVLKRVARLLP